MQTTNEKKEEPVTQLLQDAVRDARELVRLEGVLAKDEARRDVNRIIHGLIVLAVGVAVCTLALAAGVAAVVVAVGPLFGLVSAMVLAPVGGLLLFLGMRALPTEPMGVSAQRVEQDVEKLEERIA